MIRAKALTEKSVSAFLQLLCVFFYSYVSVELVLFYSSCFTKIVNFFFTNQNTIDSFLRI